MTFEEMTSLVELGDDSLIYPGPDGSIGIWRDGEDFVFEAAYGGLAPVVRTKTLEEAERRLWAAFWEKGNG